MRMLHGCMEGQLNVQIPPLRVSRLVSGRAARARLSSGLWVSALGFDGGFV